MALLVIGLVMIVSSDGLAVALIGILMMGAAAYLVYKTYMENENRGDNLNIQLNSGSDFVINIKDKGFLIEVFKVLQDNINNKQANIKIDIRNSAINYGDRNVMSIDKSEG